MKYFKVVRGTDNSSVWKRAADIYWESAMSLLFVSLAFDG